MPGFDQDDRKRRIVSAVIGLGQSLDIPTVAKGLETEAEQSVSRILNACMRNDGFMAKECLRKRPMTLSGSAPLCRDRPRCSTARLSSSCTNSGPFMIRHLSVCFLDLQYRHVRANDLFARMHGLTGEELRGKNVYDVMKGETLARVERVQGCSDLASLARNATGCMIAMSRCSPTRLPILSAL